MHNLELQTKFILRISSYEFVHCTYASFFNESRYIFLDIIFLDHDLKHVKIWVNLVLMSKHMNFFKNPICYVYELKMSFQPMDLKFFKIQQHDSLNHSYGLLQGKVAHFLRHNPIFCKVTCIYMLLTWH
jgi:hypothetical protein